MSETAAVAPSAPSTPTVNPTTVSAEPAQGSNPTPDKTTDTTQTTTASPTTPSPPRRLKVKIDGEEREESEDEVVRGYQRATAANKRMQEAAELRKAARADYEKLVKDPFGTLIGLLSPHFGEDKAKAHARALARQYAQAMEQEEQLPEEKREVLRARREAAEYRARLEQIEDAKREEENQRESLKLQNEFHQRLEKAYKAENIPDDEETLTLLVPILQSAIEKDDDLTPEDAVSIVKELREARRTRFIESLSDDEILKNPERAKRISQKLLQQTKELLKAPSSTQSGPGKSPTPERRAVEKRSLSDFFNS